MGGKAINVAVTHVPQIGHSAGAGKQSATSAKITQTIQFNKAFAEQGSTKHDLPSRKQVVQQRPLRF
jgi:hypothetical protein